MCGRKVDISHAPLDKVYYTVVHISKSCVILDMQSPTQQS